MSVVLANTLKSIYKGNFWDVISVCLASLFDLSALLVDQHQSDSFNNLNRSQGNGVFKQLPALPYRNII